MSETLTPEQVKKLEGAVTQASREIRRLELAIEALRAENETLRQIVDESAGDILRRDAEVATLRQERDAARLQNAKLLTALANLPQARKDGTP